jgi:hypothetical protein
MLDARCWVLGGRSSPQLPLGFPFLPLSVERWTLSVEHDYKHEHDYDYDYDQEGIGR